MEEFLKLPRYAFTPAAIEHAPEEPGVFALFEGQELVFIGRALDRSLSIRECLLRHQDGAHGACTMAATHYTWEITFSPAWREAQILAGYRARHRDAPRCNRPAA
ncbi:MAG TPA: hypothetical protein VEB41_17435 [Burkholderiales bacterium]|nr:hypothetical protein [Burkholderiales bacterium]